MVYETLRLVPPPSVAFSRRWYFDVTILGLSFLSFPASWVFIYYHQHANDEKGQGCFADACEEEYEFNNFNVDQCLYIFYGYLLVTLFGLLLARLVPAVGRVLAHTPYRASTVTVGELAWFSVLTFLTTFGVGAANWGYFWSQMSDYIDLYSEPWLQLVMQILACLTGLMLAVAFGFAMLPVAKYSPLNDALGVPYTASVRMHQWIGYLIFWLTMAHFITSLLMAFLSSEPVDVQWFQVSIPEWGDYNYFYPTGFVSMVFICLVVFTSLPYFRRRWYNAFFFTHFAIFIGILFAYFHSSIDIYFVLPGFFMYGVDALVRLSSKFWTMPVVSNIEEECGYRTVTVATELGAGARPGEFMRVCVPAVSYFEYHPLSIVRAGADSVTFLYPAAEPGSRQWMSRVAAHIDAAASKEGKGAARVHLQGPFGGPNRLFAEAAGLGALALFVGGTGAAPALAVVRGLLDACRSDSGSSGRNGDAEPGFLVSDSAGAVAATTVKKGVSPRHRIFLFWSVPAAGLEHLSVLRELVADAEQLGGSVQLVVELFDSSVPGVGVGLANGEDSKLETVAVHGGGDVEEIQAVAGAGDFQPVTVRTHRARPHLRGLLNHHAVPVLKAETGGRAKLGVFICGPERFTEDGLLSVRTFQSENKQVDVVLEVESYAL